MKELHPGLEVEHVGDLGLSRAKDDEIFEYAQAHGMAVMTFDEDFADKRIYPLGTHYGVIRLRIWPTTVEEIKSGILRLFERFSPADLTGALIVIDRSHIRVRKPGSK